LVLLLLGSQHADFSEQQAKPFSQQFAVFADIMGQLVASWVLVGCEAEQQADFSALHLLSFWQQPAFESAVQQAPAGLQQAAFAEQQSFDCSVAPMTLDNIKPKPSIEPSSSFVII
jgi:hypothetical protein